MSVQKDNSKTAILLDLDGTLLRTGELVEEILRQLDDDLGLKSGTLQSIYEAMWEESRLHGYDPSRFYAQVEASLGEDPSGDGTSFQDIFESKAASLVKSFLFNDVIPTLHQLSDQGFQLCIFTKGAVAWQWLKVSHAIGPESFIPMDLWFVAQDKTSQDYLAHIIETLTEFDIEQVILVDDSKKIMREVEENWPKEGRIDSPRRILIKREPSLIGTEEIGVSVRMGVGASRGAVGRARTDAETEKEMSGVTIIHSLAELHYLLSDQRG